MGEQLHSEHLVMIILLSSLEKKTAKLNFGVQGTGIDLNAYRGSIPLIVPVLNGVQAMKK
jgi:hypothetical protein